MVTLQCVVSFIDLISCSAWSSLGAIWITHGYHANAEKVETN